jgi:hypothetical protein
MEASLEEKQLVSVQGLSGAKLSVKLQSAKLLWSNSEKSMTNRMGMKP